MALKLIQEDSRGVTADYIKIYGVNIDFVNECVNISLSLYVNQDARLAEKLPLSGMGAKVAFVEGSELSRAALYTAIKGLDEFAGAVDC